jgi:hypothetical protein
MISGGRQGGIRQEAGRQGETNLLFFSVFSVLKAFLLGWGKLFVTEDAELKKKAVFRPTFSV